MGEYVLRKRDDEEIKVGTCNEMYYMTLPQLFDVKGAVGNVEELIFRVPIKEEKGILVGDFKSSKVNLKLTRIIKDWKEKDIKLFKENQGYVSVQVPLRNSDYGSGLRVGLKCSHGFNEEERNEDGSLRTFYNGKENHVFSMTGVCIRNKEIYFAIECAICGKTFRLDYEEFKDCEMYETDKTYINNIIYDLQFDEENGDKWMKLIDFGKLERM